MLGGVLAILENFRCNSLVHLGPTRGVPGPKEAAFGLTRFVRGALYIYIYLNTPPQKKNKKNIYIYTCTSKKQPEECCAETPRPWSALNLRFSEETIIQVHRAGGGKKWTNGVSQSKAEIKGRSQRPLLFSCPTAVTTFRSQQGKKVQKLTVMNSYVGRRRFVKAFMYIIIVRASPGCRRPLFKRSVAGADSCSEHSTFQPRSWKTGQNSAYAQRNRSIQLFLYIDSVVRKLGSGFCNEACIV